MTQRQQERPEVPEGTPDLYVDSVHVETQLYGSTLFLGQMRAGAQASVKVTVKISPPMLKVLSLILAKHVRNYEESIGSIAVPKDLLHNLGLEDLL